MRLFFLIVLITALSFSANNACSPTDSVSDYVINDYSVLIPLTLITVAIFIAILKTFSGALGLPPLEAWIKSEIREIIVTAVLLTIFLSVIGASDIIIQAVTGTIDGSSIDCTREAAKNVAESMLTRYENAYYSIIDAATRVRAASMYSGGASAGFILFVGYSDTPYGGAYPLLSSLNAATVGLTNAIFLYKAIVALIKFFAVAVPSFIFPAAFCLRAFPLTRRIGNTLIAIALGLAIFFPMSVILVGYLNNIIGVPYPQLTKSDLEEFGVEEGWGKKILSPICENEWVRTTLNMNELLFALTLCLPFLFIPIAGPAAFIICFNLVADIIYPLLLAAESLGLSTVIYLLDRVTANFEVGRTFDILYPFLRDVNILVVVSYIDVLLIGIITIGAIRSISTALGGEIYLPGVEKLV